MKQRDPTDSQPVSHNPADIISDIYIMIHNGSKITVMKLQQSNFMVGGNYNTMNCAKGPQHQKVENHCTRIRCSQVKMIAHPEIRQVQTSVLAYKRVL